MRLHALEVTAFGPFAGTERVDLDALAASGLFLLHGPTGAGKTSVLDAVCYALYGVVPGHRQRTARLRSDHADPADRTGVVLELTLRGRRLRVTRQPAWDRPKRRGTGTTQDPARTLVEELRGGAWSALSTRNDEAAHLLHGLLGMSAAQFCQVVLLPQGQFADFLRADAEARRPILEQLFETRRFSAVEDWLAARRRDSAARVGDARAGVDELVARASEAARGLGAAGGTGTTAAGAACAPVAERPERAAEAGAWLDALRAVAQAGAAASARARAGAQEALDGARAALDGARALHALQQRHAAARRGWQELELRAAGHQRAREVLEVGLRAAPVAALRDVERAAADRHEAALAQVEAARSAAGDLLARGGPCPDAPAGDRSGDGPAEGTGPSGTDDPPRGVPAAGPGALPRPAGVEEDGVPGQLDLLDAIDEVAALASTAEAPEPPAASATTRRRDGVAAAARGLREQAARLDGAVAEERRADELAREVAALAARADREDRRAAAARLRLTEQDRRTQGLHERVAALEPVAGGLASLDAERVAVAARHEAARERDRLAQVAAAARAAARHAVDAAQRARQDWLDLREARLEAMAAELAQGLAVGADCPVCGSPEHPSPAVHADGAAGLADAEAAAEQEHLARETERELAEAAAADAATRLGAARARAGGDAPLPDLAAELADLEQRCTGARTAAAGLAAARTDLAAARAERERSEAEAHGAGAAAAAARARHDALAADLRARSAAVEAERGAAPSVAERQAGLRRDADRLDALAAALTGLATAEGDLARAGAGVAAAACTAGFTDPAEAVGALERLVAAGGAERLRAAVEEEAARRAALHAQLHDPELAGAAGRPAPDLPGLEAAHAARAAEHEAACARDARVQAALAALDGHRAALARLLDALAPLEREHAVVDGLSRLAEGTGSDNAKRMRLSAYVLAARLEQVAAAATERLLLMSAGRYSLVHTDQGSSGRGRAGLGLRVVDAWTGQERDTTTLSGGESFTASLALALGLADVVADEAGGARLGTLFVDEGFGTLDDQALDEVMDVLDGLRAGGRVVGIVSHVADLRQRVPAQLRVAKACTGSTLHAAPA
ncbi:AAA family ATPase [Vallicoccus soli]|uniref:Nuclease SbcCD subunit C n=1 Tax=Vallicoccus soli TaxID=2339232 RepID=A0A3A3ZDM3_9ACTN|nr:AAA family ATPase [Vallicoccus soli]RJK93146.1 SMC family ATPase [Vallicoccus soli]